MGGFLGQVSLSFVQQQKVIPWKWKLKVKIEIDEDKWKWIISQRENWNLLIALILLRGITVSTFLHDVAFQERDQRRINSILDPAENFPARMGRR